MNSHDVIVLAHGEGGRLMRKLIRETIQPILNANCAGHDDAALVELASQDERRLAVTTDSYVVSPIEFPGGDIGSLAVHGTVNDLCVSGAKPLFITLSLIIEEGFSIERLKRVLTSAAAAAIESGVRIVAGDTKVLPRGMMDGLFINTTGIGQPIPPIVPGPTELEIGDELIVTAPIGKHGMAILCAREELGLSPVPQSDSASLLTTVVRLREALGERVKCMRDATRGGVAAVLHEWAESCGHTLSIEESKIPVSAEVRGACELLGLDALHVANEGTMVVGLEAGAVDQALAVLHQFDATSCAARIGVVEDRCVAPVVLSQFLGNRRPLDDPQGAPMPRIC